MTIMFPQIESATQRLSKSFDRLEAMLDAADHQNARLNGLVVCIKQKLDHLQGAA